MAANPTTRLGEGAKSQPENENDIVEYWALNIENCPKDSFGENFK